MRQSWFESEFPPSVRLTPATFPQGGRLFVFAHAFLDASRKGGFWFCTGFAVSNLASPFGWEVGPLGLGGGELACGGVWPFGFGAVLFAW